MTINYRIDCNRTAIGPNTFVVPKQVKSFLHQEIHHSFQRLHRADWSKLFCETVTPLPRSTLTFTIYRRSFTIFQYDRSRFVLTKPASGVCLKSKRLSHIKLWCALSLPHVSFLRLVVYFTPSVDYLLDFANFTRMDVTGTRFAATFMVLTAVAHIQWNCSFAREMIH